MNGYIHSTHLGTQRSGTQYGPVLHPLSTAQTPNTLPYHSYGMLFGIHPTPPLFYPGQEPVDTNMWTGPRQEYVRVQPWKPHLPTHMHHPVQGAHTNYIAPLASGLYIHEPKRTAIGKSIQPVPTHRAAWMASKSVSSHVAMDARRRVRSTGGGGVRKNKGTF